MVKGVVESATPSYKNSWIQPD